MSSVGETNLNESSREDLLKEIRILRKALAREKGRCGDLERRNDNLEDEISILRGQLQSVKPTEISVIDRTEHRRLSDQLEDAQEEIWRLKEEKSWVKSDFSREFNDYLKIANNAHDHLKLLKSMAITHELLDRPQVAIPSRLNAPSARPDLETSHQPLQKRRRLNSPPIKKEPTRSPPRIMNPPEGFSVRGSQGIEKSAVSSFARSPRSSEFLPMGRPIFPKVSPKSVGAAAEEGGDEDDDEEEVAIAKDDPRVLASLRKAGPPAYNPREEAISAPMQQKVSYGPFGAPVLSQSPLSSATALPKSSQPLSAVSTPSARLGVQNPTDTSLRDVAAEGFEEQNSDSSIDSDLELVNPPPSNSRVGMVKAKQPIVTGPLFPKDLGIILRKREEERIAGVKGATSAQGLSVIPDFNKPIPSGPFDFQHLQRSPAVDQQQQTGSPTPAQAQPPQQPTPAVIDSSSRPAQAGEAALFRSWGWPESQDVSKGSGGCHGRGGNG
ncbi:MAG: hypothetical protein L6R41_001058 [Letrouitia leprolyta]|nr:MAG: hypothetical protein L6R41_001058 [Letrouitia leprolyta]